MKKKFKFFLITLHFLFCVVAKSQLSGVYNIPGDFSSLANAITSLNLVGVNAAVTINIAAGYNEITPIGGYSLYPIAGANMSNTILFKKNGIGSNPLLYAYSGGLNYPYTNQQDGMFWFLGTDHVTIDGIDLIDLNNSNPATMEVGYGFFKNSGNDGCQYNTIRNCVVTLQKINGFSTNVSGVDGCRGIELANYDPTAYTSTAAHSVTLFAGTNSYNSIHSNTVQNCHTGISVCGGVSAVSNTITDTGNLVGGNSSSMGNVIINFGGGGTGDAAGIVTANQVSLTVSGNFINNNNGSGANGSADLRGMFIQNCAGNNINSITNNTITLTGGGVSFNHFAINTEFNNSLSNTCVLTVSNNLISNCTYTVNSSGPFKGIAYTGVGGTLHIVSNTITNISLVGNGNATMLQPSSNSTISGNVINGITLSGSGTIQGLTGGRLITNNTFENIGLSLTTATGNISACVSPSSGNSTITLNTFRNYYAPGQGTVCGIVSSSSSGTVSVINNSVYNFSTTAGGIGSTTLTGISLNNGNTVVQNNSIYSLLGSGSNTNAVGVSQGIGIYGGTINTISKNKIYDLSSSGSGALVYGINSPTTIPVGSAPSNYFSNNLIGQLNSFNSSGINQVVGINIIRTSSNYIYYNTIHFNSSSTSLTFGSSALTISSSAFLDMRNNILSNTSFNSGTGKTVCYMRTTPTFSSYAVTSNNNLFYSGIPSSSRIIFTNGSNDYVTLADYKYYANSKDNNSITELAPFTSTIGSSNNFLTISSSSTQIESAGITISGYPDDYNTAIRNSTTPDIGAFEGNYNFNDILPPTYYGSAFTSSSSCNTTSRTLTVTLGDNNGIATGSLSPKLYYKVNNGLYNSVAGTLSSGTNSLGIWSFNMSYTSVATDIISYFILAQDMSPYQNIMCLPPTGFVGTNVNNVITPPTSPLSYSIMYNLSGTYTVGAGGTFTSLTQAVNAYNYGCLSGPVEYVLTNMNYSPGQENFPITFLENPDASITNSLLVRPEYSLYVSINSGTTSSSVVKFMGANYIMLDGINSPSTGLSISQGTTSFWYPSTIWLASQGTVTGNSNITFKRLAIFGSYYGINSCRHDTISGLGGVNNNNITIEENRFYKGEIAINAVGTGTATMPYPGLINNWVIRDNFIGTVGTLSVNSIGIQVKNMNNLVFTGNTVSHMKDIGLEMQFVNGANISKNLISNIMNTSASMHTSGIKIGERVNSITVSHNDINSIYNLNNIYATGIIISQTYSTNANIYIRNNMISNIKCLPYSMGCGPAGIAVRNAGCNIEIDNNSISLNGSISFPSTNTVAGVDSYALLIESGYFGASFKIRNNILSNNFYATNATNQKHYSIYCFSSNSVVPIASQINTINRNNYNCNGVGGTFGYNQGTFLTTIPMIQSSLGGNVNSTSFSTVFTSSVNPHIAMVLGNLQLDNLGSPLPGIADDIDGQIRSITTPDIGADEFSIPTCSSAGAGTISISSQTICTGNNFFASSVGANTGVNAAFQWSVSTTSGTNYTAVSGGIGAQTPNYQNSANLSGVIYYILGTTCNGSLSATSNEVGLTVLPSPTVVASVSSNSICSGQNIQFNSTSFSGASYSWTGPNNFTAFIQNPQINNATINATGTYSLIASAQSCTSSISSVSFGVIDTPSTPSIIATNSLICAGASVSLTANGGIIPSVFNFTPQTNQNSATNLPAPYSTNFGGQKMQFLVLASELLSSGLVAGPISSIQFPVVFKNNSNSSNLNFQISIGSTSLASIGSNFINGLTIVSLTNTFTPNVGYNNYHYFNTPFIWDGISNLVIETVYSNNFAGGISNAVIQYNSNTSFQSTIVYAANNQAFNVIASATYSNVNIGFKRPDFKLTGSTNSQIQWLPNNFLSSSTGSSVVATPQSSIIYTAITNNNGCSSSANVSLNVTPIPTLQISTSSSIVCSGNSATLTASGASTYTWNNSSTQTSITVIPLSNTIYTLTSQILPCPISTATIQINVSSYPTLNIVTPTVVCKGVPFNAFVTGANTYSWFNGSNSATINLSVTTNTNISVIGSNIYGCPSQTNLTLFPNNQPTINLSPSSLSVCPNTLITFTASGANSYTWSSGAVGNITTISPLQIGSVIAYGTDNTGCTGTNVANYYVYPTPSISISPSSASICINASISFSATGASTYSWNNGVTGSVLSHNVTNNNATTYTVYGSNSLNCVGSETLIVYSLSLPILSITPINPTICLGENITLLASGASSYTWLPQNTFSSSIEATPSISSSYTLVGVDLNGCENSETLTVNVDPCTSVEEIFKRQIFIETYPNPFSEFFIIEINDYNQPENLIEIFSSKGELVYEERINKKTNKIYLGNCAPGIYLIKIGTFYSKKIVKE